VTGETNSLDLFFHNMFHKWVAIDCRAGPVCTFLNTTKPWYTGLSSLNKT